MLSIRLISLCLKNFKGIKEFKLTANGNNVFVFGENATGKTTLNDGWNWLLFGKDSMGRSDTGKGSFDIKTLDDAGNVISSGLDHTVEGIITVSGRPVTLKKIFREKWTQHRGKVSKEFEGHKTDYFIDDVPKKEGEYKAFINSIINEEVFKLLTSLTHFNDLPWQKRRNIVIDVCGDVSDEDVIASDEKLAGLPATLKGKALDDYREIIKARQTKINDELKMIPVRVDEANRAMPDITGLDQTESQDTVKALKISIKNKQEKLLQMQSGGAIAQKKTDLQNAEADILRLTNDYQTDLRTKFSDKNNSLDELTSKKRSLERQEADIQKDIITNNSKLTNLRAKLESGRAQWKKTNAEVFEFNQESTCPTCGQDIPEDRLAEARETAEAEFNQEKAEKLQANVTKGKVTKDEIEYIEKCNAGYSVEINQLKKQVEEIEQEVAKLQTEISEVRTTNTLEKFPGYAENLQKKAEIKASITALQEGGKADTDKAEHEIADIEVQITETEIQLKKFDDRQKQLDRIAELKGQAKKLAAEYEKLEGELNLTDMFTRTKVSLLGRKIEAKFKHVRFKMFNQLVNGGLEPCCETTLNGITYGKNLNTAGEIFAGIDIINTLIEHYQLDAPIFVDGRESITANIESPAQIIGLVVSKPDKSLRVELEPETKGEVA